MIQRSDEELSRKVPSNAQDQETLHTRSRKRGPGRAVLPHHYLAGRVDLRGHVGRPAAVRVVEQHDLAVGVLDRRLLRTLLHTCTEDTKGG